MLHRHLNIKHPPVCMACWQEMRTGEVEEEAPRPTPAVQNVERLSDRVGELERRMGVVEEALRKKRLLQ